VTGDAGEGFVDLQVHSTASDGAVAAEAIPALAKAAGLQAFALTDHDTVAGVAAATAAGAVAGVRVIAGVELSATLMGRELHILGLHIDATTELEERLIALRGQRAARARAIVQRLQELGLAITDEDVTGAADGAAIGRPHLAKALMVRGHVGDRREAFDRYLGAGRPAYVPKPEFAAVDAIALIHAAHGLAIWAHPSTEGRADRVRALAGMGIDGIEVKHPSHNAEDVRRLQALADHFTLLPSGGSDWHGDATGRRVLGGMQVPAAWLVRQEQRRAARLAAGT
jgi:predicted metal-dependent phosphoesterase TrpH